MPRVSRVWVDDRALKRYFRGMEARAQNFRPVFRWARRELQKANIANFASRGGLSGHWASLDNEYARWKLENYGPRRVLVATGALYRSLRSLRGYPNDIGPKEATFGTDIPYAKFHQYGTSEMPRRKVVFVPPTFAFQMAQRTGEYLVYGNGATAIWRRLKGLFKE